MPGWPGAALELPPYGELPDWGIDWYVRARDGAACEVTVCEPGATATGTRCVGTKHQRRYP